MKFPEGSTVRGATRIGKYAVLSLLGRGGMGAVYRCWDEVIGREVAIKTLTTDIPELRQRFITEARAGVLNHPYIVMVFDAGELDEGPFIVMELVAGESLEKILRSGRDLSLLEKLTIVYQMCVGLGFAHAKGVIHRDVKPANIIVQPDGNIKIMDFGIARLTTIRGNTQTGAVIGTMGYIAPERLRGLPADARVDIWSAGVTLYRLLTGQLPFESEDPAVMGYRIISEPFAPIGKLVEGCPPQLNDVLDHALAKDPDYRYSTAEEMAIDIEVIIEKLKQEQLAGGLSSAKQLIESGGLTRARLMLLDLLRQDPGNTAIRSLFREVQYKLSQEQKTREASHGQDDAEEDLRQEASHAQRSAVPGITGPIPTQPDPGGQPLHQHSSYPASGTPASPHAPSITQIFSTLEDVAPERDAMLLEPPFEAYEGKQPFIFVSYCHSDSAIVYPEIDQLHRFGFRIWFDEGIASGKAWAKEVASALDRCDFFLVFISPRSVESPHVLNEIDFAIKRRKPFMLVHVVKTDLPIDLELSTARFQAILKWSMTSDRYQRQLAKSLPSNLRDN